MRRKRLSQSAVMPNKQRHYVVALDPLGQLLGERSFAAGGYAELERWADRFGEAEQLGFGVEGAGSWGASVCQHLQDAVTPCSRSSARVDATSRRQVRPHRRAGAQPNGRWAASTSRSRAAAEFSGR
jgi:hypothetical protein